jgi:hypothetical protein
VWPDVERFFEELADSRPEVKTRLIKGRWEDVLVLAEPCDSCFFDDYPDMSMTQAEESARRFPLFLTRLLTTHLSSHKGKVSFYCQHKSSTDPSDGFKYLNDECITTEHVVSKVTVPPNCPYAQGMTMWCPVLTYNGGFDARTSLIGQCASGGRLLSTTLAKIRFAARVGERPVSREMMFDEVFTAPITSDEVTQLSNTQVARLRKIHWPLEVDIDKLQTRVVSPTDVLPSLRGDPYCEQGYLHCFMNIGRQPLQSRIDTLSVEAALFSRTQALQEELLLDYKNLKWVVEQSTAIGCNRLVCILGDTFLRYIDARPMGQMSTAGTTTKLLYLKIPLAM